MDIALARLAARQGGIITRDQALAVLSPAEIRRRLRRGVWRPTPWRGIYVDAEVPDDVPSLVRAAGLWWAGTWSPATRPRRPSGASASAGWRDRRVGAEYDGGIAHLTRDQLRADRDRHNWLTENGWTLLHFTDLDVYRRHTRMVVTVRRLLDAPPPDCRTPAIMGL